MSYFFLESPFISLFFLFGCMVLTACNTCLVHLGRFKSNEFFKRYMKAIFFLGFQNRKWDHLYFSISLSKHIFQLAYATAAFFYLLNTIPSFHSAFTSTPSPHDWTDLFAVAGIITFISIFFDFTTRLTASIWSRLILKIAAPLAFIYLLLLYPIVECLWLATYRMLKKVRVAEEEILDKTRLREMIRESELQQHLDPADQKMIASFLNFKERVAKEIMVPRVDIFSLDASTTIQEASRLFAAEGYSRIPIYKESLDQILGVVLYKDLLHCFTTPNQKLDAPLETIAKPVLYAPENKKIAQLLQEFRNKQIHMAIIVDEYGGTEGVVTIEDILEELVGEIEDEYDVGEEHEFWEIPTGGWMVDAKMTIHDIEAQLGVKIPPHPDYETVGGYVYHCAGTIPNKGWRLSHDDFDLEVIASNERSIKKIKITPRLKNS